NTQGNEAPTDLTQLVRLSDDATWTRIGQLHEADARLSNEATALLAGKAGGAKGARVAGARAVSKARLENPILSRIENLSATIATKASNAVILSVLAKDPASIACEARSFGVPQDDTRYFQLTIKAPIPRGSVMGILLRMLHVLHVFDML